MTIAAAPAGDDDATNAEAAFDADAADDGGVASATRDGGTLLLEEDVAAELIPKPPADGDEPLALSLPWLPEDEEARGTAAAGFVANVDDVDAKCLGCSAGAFACLLRGRGALPAEQDEPVVKEPVAGCEGRRAAGFDAAGSDDDDGCFEGGAPLGFVFFGLSCACEKVRGFWFGFKKATRSGRESDMHHRSIASPSLACLRTSCGCCCRCCQSTHRHR